MEVFFVILHEVRYNRLGFPASFTAAWVKKWIWTQFESKYYEFAGWTVIPSKVAYRLAQQTPSKNQLTEASSTHLGEASFLTNNYSLQTHAFLLLATYRNRWLFNSCSYCCGSWLPWSYLSWWKVEGRQVTDCRWQVAARLFEDVSLHSSHSSSELMWLWIKRN